MRAELEKKIVKIGRSKGVIIPPLFLKLLDLDIDNNIILSLEDNKIIIRKK